MRGPSENCGGVVPAPAGSSDVLHSVRFPATRRPDQLHNVSLALAAMQRSGMTLEVPPPPPPPKKERKKERKKRHSIPSCGHCGYPRCSGACVLGGQGTAHSPRDAALLAQQGAAGPKGPLEIRSTDLVVGNREATLCLLWKMAVHFQVCVRVRTCACI
jgi:hypothetical protein